MHGAREIHETAPKPCTGLGNGLKPPDQGREIIYYIISKLKFHGFRPFPSPVHGFCTVSAIFRVPCILFFWPFLGVGFFIEFPQRFRTCLGPGTPKCGTRRELPTNWLRLVLFVRLTARPSWLDLQVHIYRPKNWTLMALRKTECH